MTSRKVFFRREKKRATSNIFSMFDQAQVIEFKEAFNMIDQNRDGLITGSDLRDILSSLGKTPTKEYIDKMMEQSNGPLNFTMFLILFGEQLRYTDPEETIKAAFECFDEKRTGLISEKVFREILLTREKFSEEYVDEILRVFPPENGSFNYLSFIKSMRHGAIEQTFQPFAKSESEA